MIHMIKGNWSGMTTAGDQNFTQDSSAIVETAATDDEFGTSVAVADFDDDGYADVAIGVPGENRGGDSRAGGVNIIYGASTGLTTSGNEWFDQDTSGVGGSTTVNAEFGISLRAGQIDGDAPVELLIGRESNNLTYPIQANIAGLYGAGWVQYRLAGAFDSGTLTAIEADTLAKGMLTADVKGTQTITVKAALDDWNADHEYLVNHWAAAGNAGWRLEVDNGTLAYTWSDGSSATTLTSDTSAPLVDGEAIWLRVIFDPEPTSGNANAVFQYRTADTGSFTTFDTVTHSSTSEVEPPSTMAGIGRKDPSNVSLHADVYVVDVDDDQGGVWQIDFTNCTVEASSCSEGGHTWTLSAGGSEIRDAETIGGILTTFTHDPAGANGGPHAVASRTVDGVTTDYSYDVTGNLTETDDGTTVETLTWDARGRLSTWTDGSDTWSFSYDGLGQRVSAVNGEDATVFVGDVEIASDGTGLTYYGFGLDRVVRTTLGSSSQLTVALADHLGSPNSAVDPSNGSIVHSELHRPYGEIRHSGGAKVGSRGFTGQPADPTGMVYFGARYYSPQVLSFLAPDDIGVATGGTVTGLNRYSYTDGNPVGAVDPTGHVVTVFDPGPRMAPLDELARANGVLWFDTGMALFGAGDADGRFAQWLGAYDAQHVAIVVPGVDNDLHNLSNLLGNAQNLLDQMEILDPGNVAVIACLCYDTPDAVGFGASIAPAEAGAAELASFLASIDVYLARRDVTLVGHSYGSTTIGTALRYHGLAASVDRVAVVGSPGVNAGSLGQLGLGEGDFFAAIARWDYVRFTPGLGPDPRHIPGAITFTTGGSSGHSEYFKLPGDSRGSSLLNLGLIAVGQVGDVAVQR